MSVMFDVVLVDAVGAPLLVVLGIHVAGVPVAMLRRTLRTPVGPDSELGVTEPLRELIVLFQ